MQKKKKKKKHKKKHKKTGSNKTCLSCKNGGNPPSVSVFSETARPIEIKWHKKHHCNTLFHVCEDHWQPLSYQRGAMTVYKSHILLATEHPNMPTAISSSMWKMWSDSPVKGLVTFLLVCVCVCVCACVCVFFFCVFFFIIIILLCVVGH